MGSAFESPDSVQLKGKVKGVTRLSRKAKFGIFTLIVLAILVIVVSVLSMDEESSAPAQAGGEQQGDKAAAVEKPVTIPATPNFDNIGDGQAALAVQAAASPGQASEGPAPQSAGNAATVQGGQNLGPAYNVANGQVPKLTDKALSPGTPVLASSNGTQAAAAQPGTQPGTPAPQPSQKDIDESNRKLEMAERKRKAILASLDVPMSDTGSAASSGQVAALAAMANQQEALLKAAQQSMPSGMSVPAMGLAGAVPQDDPNKQQRKEQFLKTAGESAGKAYLAEGVQLALSPFEIKAGWAIPAELQCAINSDLPGQFCGRITENVFDSATGKNLLIPQHTTFVGTYDSQIAYGQERLLPVVTRLIFPDGSSLNLGGMPGADRAGNAGFEADVNNHYGKVLGSAAFLATFSGAISLTQKQNVSINGQQTNSQVITQSLGQQLGQTGTAFIQRGMNVQPTLSRKPGYRFNIMVTKDIIFPGSYKRREVKVH